MTDFVFSTEVVSIIMGIIVLYFAVHNECVRTKKLLCLLVANYSIMTCCALEVLMRVISVTFHAADDINVTCFCILYVLLHITTISSLLMYVQNLSELHYDIRKVNICIISTIVIYLLIGLVLGIRGEMYEIRDGMVSFRWLVPYIECMGVAATIACFAEVMCKRKGYPLTIFRYIRLFMPVVLFLQIVQVKIGGIIFNGIIYIMSVMVLFFLYHNENYNVETGERTNVSFEEHMNKIFKKKMAFDLLVIQISRDTSVRNKESNAHLLLWKISREMEYCDNKVFIYNIEEDMYAILCTNQKKERRERFLECAKGLAKMAENECEGAVGFVIYHYENHDCLNSLQDLKTFVSFLRMEKGVGENFCWYDPPEDSYEKFETVNRVYRNVADIIKKCDPGDERVLCYAQPIYKVETQDFHSAEALMRLKLDDEIISPAMFIPIVERLGGMHALTIIMLHKVCMYIRENKDLDFQEITINCSPYELSSKGFAKEILEIIQSYEVNPGMISLELTEGTEAGKLGVARENMRVLLEAGMHFYLDDFGTGYSNISKLLQYRLHTIKFDKTMLYQSMSDNALCEAVAALAKSFHAKGTHILVEGVEDGSQEELAFKMGFEYIQGYKYAKPVPIEQLGSYFARK